MGGVSSRVQSAFNRRERSRRNRGNGGEEGDPNQLDIYSRCASEGSSYFGSHIQLGDTRCKMAEPEASLFFLENKELDLLGDKPVAFPYSVGGGADNDTIVIPVNCLVNVRKETVKFVRIPKEEGDTSEGDKYLIEFTYDCDKSGFIQLHFNALEQCEGKEVKFVYRDAVHIQHSDEYPIFMGADQVFRQFVFDTAEFDIAKDMSRMTYKGGNFYPIVISCTIKEDGAYQVQTTVCTITQSTATSPQSLILKPKRQRIAVDGVFYLMQELFGLENKEGKDMEEQGFECLICMNEIRDTVILPCRHICICYSCAGTLRQKANNCPICRKPFRALIQMIAKKTISNGSDSSNGARRGRYEQMMLVEALNGTLNHPLGSSSTASSIALDMVDEVERRTSTKSRGQKVIGKKAVVEELKETPDGIELKSAECFLHHPVNVVVVKPVVKNVLQKDEATSSTSLERDNLPSTSSEPESTPENSARPVISSDPSSSDSQDSTGALLKKSLNENMV